MKCPACVAEAKTSIFREQWIKPKKGEEPEVERFFDEDGHKHVHDHAVRTLVLTCSNGHAYRQDLEGRCPHRVCEWNQRPMVKAQDEKIGETV